MRLCRFSISVEKKLLNDFDTYLEKTRYSNRSEAIRDLIREALTQKEWSSDERVAGVITLLYNHHKREVVNRLLKLQHDASKNIVSTQHIHLDHDNCLEIIALKGPASSLQVLFWNLRAVKGVKHATFNPTTLGKKFK